MSIVRARFARFTSETGTTLIEVTIACAILLVVMSGLMGMAALATSITENQGHLGARTTEYAVDKMEQVLELTYGDAQSNTTVFPSVNNGGTGLALGGSARGVLVTVLAPLPALATVGQRHLMDGHGSDHL